MKENRALVKASTILLISFTIFAYLIKTIVDQVECLILLGNILVAVVNLALLERTSTSKIIKVLITLLSIIILFLMIILSLDAKYVDALLNLIAVISISFTFLDLQKK